ncbi:MAG: hypothetical protein L0G99_12475, partial [Propionibacteriales bacterium]|nr:hypothetical protein [Propionibacteriales bacterium]
GPMFIDQWKQVLSIEVKQDSKADQVFQKEMVPAHNFQMAVWNVNLNGPPYNAYQAYSRANLAEEPQKNGFGNQGLWKAPDAVEQALEKLQQTAQTDTETMKEQVRIIQQAIIDEAPIIPFLPGGGGEMTTVKNWDGWPEIGSSDFPPRTGGYNNICQTLMKLKPSG